MKKILLFAAAAFVAASASAATEWVSIITGGNAADGETNAIQAGWSGPAKVVANPAGEGEVFTMDIPENTPNDNGNFDDWKSQMFICFDEPLQAGDVVKVEFEQYCTDARTVGMQAQGDRGTYQGNFQGFEAKSEWQKYSEEITVTEQYAGADGFKNIAICLSGKAEAAVFYIKDVKVLKAQEVEDPVTGTSLIQGGVAADGTTPSLQAGWSGDAQVVANPAGDGVVFTMDIPENTPNDNGNFDDWKSQMFICFDEPVLAGDVVKVEFDHYCTDTRTVGMQAQGNKGTYQGNFQGFEAKSEWQKYSEEITVTEQYAGEEGFKTIAICLSGKAEAATFYMNNVVVEKKAAGVQTIAPVKVQMTGVYNLNGVKVADSIDQVTVPGLYITNGKKVIKK